MLCDDSMKVWMIYILNMILREFFISGSDSCCQLSSFFVRGGKPVCLDHDVSFVFLMYMQ